MYVSPLSKNCPGEVGVTGCQRRNKSGEQNGIKASRGGRIQVLHVLQPVAAAGWCVPSTEQFDSAFILSALPPHMRTGAFVNLTLATLVLRSLAWNCTSPVAWIKNYRAMC